MIDNSQINDIMNYMEFLSIREFSAAPRKSRETLKRKGRIVLTNNGKPSMLVFDIVGRDIGELIDTLNRAEAMRLLEEIQMQASGKGLDSITIKEINAEVKAVRQKKRRLSAAGT